MPIRRNYIDIKTDGKYRVENNTPISEFNDVSIAGSMLDMIGVEGESLYDEIDYLHKINDPTTNVGRELDNVAFMLGTSRDQSTLALDASDTNFYFYLDPRTNLTIGGLINYMYPTSTHYQFRQNLFDDGYIDDIAAPTRLTIPAGTIISNFDQSISYRTLENIEINNSSPEGYVGVIANVTGASHNIESNVLIKHSLKNYSAMRDLAKYIMCTNRFPISTGRDSSADEEFRYNILLSRISYDSNEAAVRRAALSVPGVRNILFERGRFGHGTFNIIVEGISPLVSQGLLNIVKERVQAVVGGDTVFVTRPEYIGVELNFDISVAIGIDIDLAREQVRNDIIGYINDLPMGGTIIWNQMIAIIVDRTDVEDFTLSYYKMGEYDIFNKINKKQVVLRSVNQRSHYNEKFYTDSGLISVCCRQRG